jgi:hypothetical protein
MKRDQGQGLGAESGRVLKTQVPFEFGLLPIAIVLVLACHLTGATADALGDVNQR